MMTVRKMFALFTAVFMTACLFAMFGAPDVQAAATAPNMDRRPRHSTFVDKNRKTVEIPVAALANGADLTSVAVWICPYDIVFDNVRFVSTTTAADPASGDGGVIGLLAKVADGGTGATTTLATQLAYGPINTWKDGVISVRSCKAGDVVKFGITIAVGTTDSPAGVLQLDYHMQDVVAYDADGGLI